MIDIKFMGIWTEACTIIEIFKKLPKELDGLKSSPALFKQIRGTKVINIKVYPTFPREKQIFCSFAALCVRLIEGPNATLRKKY